MFKRHFKGLGCLLAVVLLSACDHSSESTDLKPSVAADPLSQRHIQTGDVVGFSAANNTYAWLGIPYAQAPVGELRWRAPRPPVTWPGARDSTQFGDFCPQFAGVGVPVDKSRYGQLSGSEDCLSINVWAPKQSSQPLPVMFWIHGGGNSIGTAATYAFAANLAETRQVVVVALNYRLGSLGWFMHPLLEARQPLGDGYEQADKSGNYGTLDLIAGLQWVQTNISSFGGDPANVTIFGESAGGYNVYSLMLSPLAEGLFHKAIAQSGGIRATSLADAQNPLQGAAPGQVNSSGEILLALVRREHQAMTRAQAAEWLAQQDPVQLGAWLQNLPVADVFAGIGDRWTMGMYKFPQLLTDGYVLPAMSPQALAATLPIHNPVPLMTGTNRDEMKMFMLSNPHYTGYWFGKIPHALDTDRYQRDATYGSALWRILGADNIASTLVKRPDSPAVFTYRFDFDALRENWLVSLRQLLGAAHGLEIGYVFGVPGDFGSAAQMQMDSTLTQRQQLAAAMSSYWTNFAYTGSPGRGRDNELPLWSAWATDEANIMLLGSTDSDATNRDIRLIHESLTLDQLKQTIQNDPQLQASQADLCATWQRVFYRNLFGEWLFDPTEYAQLGKSGCTPLEP